MDHRRVDALARTIASPQSRRSLLRAAALAIAAHSGIGRRMPAVTVAKTAPPADFVGEKAGSGIQTIVVFAPGIDPQLSAQTFDPYRRVQETFFPIIERLGCASSPDGEPMCEGGVSWIPYSYTGVDPASGPRAYSGADTGQALLVSGNAMQDTVSWARALAPGARVVIVGHSLGGAVAAFYGGDDPDAEVITLDAPVNGIWTDDTAILQVYCADASGLEEARTGDACAQATGFPGLRSAAVADLRRLETQARMGKANAINFANAVDLTVPSWFASNPATAHGTVLMETTCANPEAHAASDSMSDDREIPLHGCVIFEAAPDVVDIVQQARWPQASALQPEITLEISANSAGGPMSSATNAEVQVFWSGQTEPLIREMTTPLGSDQSDVTIPWRDVLVELTLTGALNEPLGTYCRGALPGANTTLAVPFDLSSATPGQCRRFPELP
ncbi:MAG: hypothetical protein QM692_11115 [Thermomicrobiales bacterium]